MSTISTENFDEKPAATMAIEFETFEVPGARTYFGNTLPYGLQVKQAGAATPAVEDTAAALRKLGESGKLQELLERHGAVLVRGAGHPSADTFAKLVGAAEEGRGSRPHVQIGLAGKRTPLTKNVWTANEGSPLTRFYQHNEVWKPPCDDYLTILNRHMPYSTRDTRASLLISTSTASKKRQKV